MIYQCYRTQMEHVRGRYKNNIRSFCFDFFVRDGSLKFTEPEVKMSTTQKLKQRICVSVRRTR